MLDDRQRREALGVALTALGALVALAVIPPFLAPGAGEGNLIGPAGAALHRWLALAFGVSAAVVPLPAFAWGLRHFGVWGTGVAVRLSLLAGSLLVLLPAAIGLLRGEGASGGPAGWLGGALAGALAAAFGGVGAWLIVLSLLLAFVVLTLGVSLAGGTGAASRAARRAARVGWGRAVETSRAALGRWRRAREAARTCAPNGGASPWERAAAEAAPPPEPAGMPPARGATGAPGVARPPRPPFPPLPGAEETPAVLADPGDLEQMALPPIDLLDLPAASSGGMAADDLRDLGEVLVNKLATFRVEGRIGGWTTGPVVTQFEVVPAAGVKVGQIAALADDLALALRAPSVRIVAPIPGKGAVGVEVPNPEPQIVYLREILEAPSYQRSRAALPIALGRDLAGHPTCADLARMPHLLIAGATGSGKSICINTLLTSLIYRRTPRELRLLLVDPKMVELSVYNELPHLRHPVVTDNHQAARVLRWAMYQMNDRYALLSANACRNLVEFNRRVTRGEEPVVPSRLRTEYDGGILPYIVLVIDELADLIMTVQAEVETPLAILAQKARAVGIHLVVATQRPSVNIITGLIKANFPCRIAFRVASKTDSRTILDQNGAESLLGNGDMLFLPPGESDPVRLQGAFLTTSDTERLIAWYREQAVGRREVAIAAPEPDILDEVEELEAEEGGAELGEGISGDWDDLFQQAAEIVINHDSGSTSLLQRRLKIGYGRAARIIDQLHEAGVLGPPDGSKPREVMVTHEQFQAMMRGEEPPAERPRRNGSPERG